MTVGGTEESALRKIVMTVEYEGTRYYGFQAQKELPTVQEELERSFYTVTGEQSRLIAASRTDAGVHAKGQAVAFRSRSKLSTQSFVAALNYYLPLDIAVVAAHQIDVDFDVRRDAKSREYRYTMLNRQARSPFKSRFACLVRPPLDAKVMSEAAHVLVGEHDFAPFSGLLEGGKKGTVRVVYKAEVERRGDRLFFDMVADSFLPHQVRKTIGCLMEVGKGKMAVEEFWQLAQSKQHGVAGPTAPALGLCLMKVNYDHL